VDPQWCELCRSPISFNMRHHRALKMSQKATVHQHILCPIGSEWDRLFSWGKVSSEEFSVNFLQDRSMAPGHGDRGAILSWLCVKDHNCTGLNGHHRLWQPSRDTKHLVLSKKQNKKKQYRRKIKKAKKQKKKKTEEAIGEPDLDRDTWSDAGQCHYDRKRQDGSVPNQILCCHTLIRPINPNGSGGICCEIKSQILRLELGEKPLHYLS